MTTIPTTHRQRNPLWAALAIAASLVVGGVVGVAVEHANDRPVHGRPSTSTQQEPGTASGAYPSVNPLTFDPDPGEHRDSAPR
jgi:hypothetical protein